MALIERVLPDGAEGAELYTDAPAEYLYPEEAAAVAGASPGRQEEFRSVRTCARRALGRLGLPPVPLLPAERGAPGWPDGVVGSMTHCPGYRAAAAARSGPLLALGVDAEPDLPLADRVLARIALTEERDQVAELQRSHTDHAWDRLLFSAKECVYKCWFPLTGRWLGFHQARIQFGPNSGADDGIFTVTLLESDPALDRLRPPPVLTGRWSAGPGLLVSGLGLTAG